MQGEDLAVFGVTTGGLFEVRGARRSHEDSSLDDSSLETRYREATRGICLARVQNQVSIIVAPTSKLNTKYQGGGANN
jgi:hypothetical protein